MQQELGEGSSDQRTELEVEYTQFPAAFFATYMYRVIHKSLRDFRTRLRNNQDRHGRNEHINR